MDLRVTPAALRGSFTAPASKSASHRALIAAALAKGESRLSCLADNDDIAATAAAMTALGAHIRREGDAALVCGIMNASAAAEINCRESGSTLRFLLPVAAALGTEAAFFGEGRLPNRPIEMLLSGLRQNGINDDYAGTLPFTIHGALRGGRFEIDGGVSSQFITGLLFALPLCETDSQIVIRGRLESKPYVDMTLDTLRRFGVQASPTQTGYLVKGGQEYRPASLRVEGDYSGAAFLLAAGAIKGDVTCTGLEKDSLQGDRAIVALLERFGAGITADANAVRARSAPLRGITIDAADIPDLVPILGVTAAFARGRTVITGAKRLRMKESDRLQTVRALINGLGGSAEETEDGLVIEGEHPLTGGEAQSFGDHRIAMAAAVAALGCGGPVIIRGAECAAKSYPRFYEDLGKLGGSCDVV